MGDIYTRAAATLSRLLAAYGVERTFTRDVVTGTDPALGSTTTTAQTYDSYAVVRSIRTRADGAGLIQHAALEIVIDANAYDRETDETGVAMTDEAGNASYMETAANPLPGDAVDLDGVEYRLGDPIERIQPAATLIGYRVALVR